MSMDFSLVSTVFNEAARLNQTINDLERQTLKPTEIIVTDAGSNDGTYEMLLNWKRNSKIPISILQKKRCNVAEGRNLAIDHAQYDIIASMDFGCRFEPEWLDNLISRFKDGNVKVVGGAFKILENEQQTDAAKAAYLMSNGYDFNFRSPFFIPSSRSIAYKKEVFKKIGGYCEWLTLAGDDMVYGLCIRSLGYPIHLSESKDVSWGRHKDNKGFLREAERYGLGEGEAKILKSKAIRSAIVLSMELLWVITLALNVIYYFKFRDFYLPLVIITLITSVSLKPIMLTMLYWLKIRSPKYNFKILLRGIYLLHLTKFCYLKGYFNGYFRSNESKVNGAAKLHESFSIR